MTGSFVGAPGDYLGMTVDEVVTSGQRVGSIFQSDASRCGALSFVVI
jgi:hypothetical protein